MAPRKKTSPDKSGNGSLITKPRNKKSANPTEQNSGTGVEEIWDIEMVELDRLIPDPANLRLHDEHNIDTIKASLEEFEQHSPLVVQRSTGRIIIGNGRFEAMKQLGWEKALVHWVNDDDTKALRRAIVDNRAGELASWDEFALNKILGEFKFDGELRIPGFEDWEIPNMDIDFSPNLDPTQANVDFSAEDMAKANEKLMGQFSDDESGLVEVTCPSCGESFYLQKRDIDA